MPVTSPVSVVPISQEEFAQLDYRVLRHAFDCQNELGRLCDEVIYQNDLAARLESAGLGPVHKEVPVTVTHRDFTKVYSLDLVVGNAAIYELKSAACLIGEHDAQLLNYLLLRNANHGKLVNFRPPQLESRFVNTSLTPKTQRQFEVSSQRWQALNEASRFFRTCLLELMEDWGCFLELPLYAEAVIHFVGGEAKALRTVPLRRCEKMSCQ